jgi:hypothetical protein
LRLQRELLLPSPVQEADWGLTLSSSRRIGSPADPPRPSFPSPTLRRSAAAALLLYVLAALLSIKAAFDLVVWARAFPAWFVPSFVAGLAVLIAAAGIQAVGTWRAVLRGPSRGSEPRPVGGRRAAVLWILLALSCVCTSSVHQFYPFRLAPLAAYEGISPVLAFNLVLAAAAFLATAALGLLYRSGRRETALLGLVALGFVLFVPNDDCRNPFNEWWITTLGASPLMFVPNLYAIVFGLGALLGVRTRLGTVAVAAVCLGTALLGLGHMTRTIW